jgi:hypothetical protein
MSPKHLFNDLRARLFGPTYVRVLTRLEAQVKLLLVVEGEHDATFLRGMSRILHFVDAMLPDLGEWERNGTLVVVPIGGGDILSWTERMAAFRLPELHLLDREVPPATTIRQQAVEIVNRRPNCRAYLTRKRALENYLHPVAVRAVSKLDVTFGDDDDVADLVARLCYERQDHELPWDSLPGRARKRCREKAKRWLNRQALWQMSAAWLDERDPHGEVRSWLKAIVEMTTV